MNTISMQCAICGKVYCWAGHPLDKPKCPSGHDTNQYLYPAPTGMSNANYNQESEPDLLHLLDPDIDRFFN